MGARQSILVKMHPCSPPIRQLSSLINGAKSCFLALFMSPFISFKFWPFVSMPPATIFEAIVFSQAGGSEDSSFFFQTKDMAMPEIGH